MYTLSHKQALDILDKDITIFDCMDSDCELDKNIMDFILEYYDVPKNIRENTDLVAQVPHHKLGHLYLTHNKPFEKNDSLIMVMVTITDHPFYKISQEEFEEIRKNENFIHIWEDEPYASTIFYKMTPLTKIDGLGLRKKMESTFGWSAETTDKVVGKLAEIGVVLLKESKKQK